MLVYFPFSKFRTLFFKLVINTIRFQFFVTALFMEYDNCGLLFVRNIEKNSSNIVNKRFLIRQNDVSQSVQLIQTPSYLKNCDGYFSPKSLFRLCNDLIVHNLHLLDSLRGFPQQIAENLFLNASRLGCFIWTKYKRSIDNLQIFSTVYDDVILTQLYCSGMKNLFVDQAWIHLQVLIGSYLTKLDISDCDLSDNHEIFKQFQRFSK